jgi:biotin carboxylase
MIKNEQYLLFLNARGVIEEQFVILNAARELGYNIIFLSSNMPDYMKDYISHQVAREGNESKIIDKAIELAKTYNIVGVFSFNDPDVELASKISKALNTPGVIPESAHLARNKYKMRVAVYAKEKELVPNFTQIKTKQDIENANISFPAILKPISAAGSKGIFTVNNKEEALLALEKLIEISKVHSDGELYKRYGEVFILEEFISGQEFSVEGIVVGDRLYIAGITDKLTTDDWRLEYRHIFPANYDISIMEEIKSASSKIVKILGLNNCAIHLEAKWSNGKFKLIEIAARVGGDLISTHLIAKSLGINYIKTVIHSIVSGIPPVLPESQSVSGIQFKMTNKKIIFNGLKLDSNIYNILGLDSVKELLRRGTEILLPPEDFTLQRLGFAVVQGANFIEVSKKLDTVMGYLNLYEE